MLRMQVKPLSKYLVAAKEKELETRRIMEDLEAQKAEFEQNLPPGQKLLQVTFS